MFKISLTVTFLFLSFFSFAQKKNENVEYRIHRTTSPIKIDGIVDEKGWADAQLATDFYQVLPMDTSYAKDRKSVV